MILDKSTAEKKLKRMALEVAERNHDKKALVLMGIKENGIFIAYKIAAYLKEIFTGEIEVIALSLDKKRPDEIKLEKEIDCTSKNILLIDDVANSGRTMMYALKPLLKQWPAQIETLALVERTHKKFPVCVDYVGLSVSTTSDEHIEVIVKQGEVESVNFMTHH
jgi:pyrimidine operon attenuation protein / uracil phosphoribosyltransferase